MTLNELIAKLQIAAPKLGEKQVRYVIDLTGEMNIPNYDWDNLEDAMKIKNPDRIPKWDLKTAKARIDFEAKRYRDMAYSCGDAWGASNEREKYDRIAEGLEKVSKIINGDE